MEANNNEKYRALYDFVTDPQKSQMFNSAGLFGSLVTKENHEVLALFANWVDQSKKANGGQLPVTLNSDGFITHLEKENEKNPGKYDETITELKRLKTLRVIQNEPIANNTFLTFARILNDLNIIDIEDAIIPRYEEALEAMKSLQQGQKTAPGIGRAAIAPKARINEKTPETNKTPEKKEKKIENSGTENESETNSKAESRAESEAEAEASATITGPQNQISIQAPQAPAIPQAQTPIQPAAPGTPAIPKTPTTSATPTTPATPAGIKKVLPDFRSRQDLEIEKLEESQPSAESRISTSINTTHAEMALPGRKKVRSLRGKSGLRTARQNAGPRRIQDPRESAQNRGVPQTPQTAQAQQTPQTQEFNQNNRQTRQEEETARQEEPNKNHFGKRLAKLAGVSAGAGTILPLFSGSSSADAATFITHHSEKFIQPIITLIQIFLK